MTRDLDRLARAEALVPGSVWEDVDGRRIVVTNIAYLLTKQSGRPVVVYHYEGETDCLARGAFNFLGHESPGVWRFYHVE